MKRRGHVAREFVYLIGSQGSGVAKIGRSSQVLARQRRIQHMSPVALELLWQHAGGADLETKLHRHFKDKRLHGEWFDFGEDDPVAAVESAVALIMVEPVSDEPISVRLQRQAREIAAGRRELEELILEAHRCGQSLRQIAVEAEMTPEGIRKLIARAERGTR